MNKATHSQTRHHNSRLVLKTIYDAGEISRAEIARRTALTRPTVSTLAADLLHSKLIVETGPGPSAGGKRPTLLSINDDGPCLLTLDLSGDDYRGALVTLRGRILRRAVRPAAALRGEAALGCAYQLAAELLPAGPLLGIGVATPGLVDPFHGVVLRAVNRHWIDLPLRQQLAERFECPVYVVNDSHMAALAEYTYGDVPSGHSVIVIRVGQGVGAGVILHGRAFYGDGYGAGEIGHVVVDPGGQVCSCGNRGCLEMTSSVPAMLRAAAVAGDAPTWAEFAAAAVAGEPAAVAAAERAGRHLGMAVAQLIGAYNIHTVVLAGRVVDLGPMLLDAARDEMRRRVLPAMAAATTLRYPSLEPEQLPDLITLGCSALVLQQELRIP